jgi:hypothetical protein
MRSTPLSTNSTVYNHSWTRYLSQGQPALSTQPTLHACTAFCLEADARAALLAGACHVGQTGVQTQTARGRPQELARVGQNLRGTGPVQPRRRPTRPWWQACVQGLLVLHTRLTPSTKAPPILLLPRAAWGPQRTPATGRAPSLRCSKQEYVMSALRRGGAGLQPPYPPFWGGDTTLQGDTQDDTDTGHRTHAAHG